MYGTTLETDFGFSTPGPQTDASPVVRFTCEEVSAPFALDPCGLVDTQGRRDDGQVDFAFYRLEGHDAVRITGAADFLVRDTKIRCRLVDPAHRYLVEIALLGMIFALWLERRGVPTLHASAGVISGRAVGFLANKGGGKTSLAAACAHAGGALLTDDLLAIGWRDGTTYGERGWPALRLWPDQLQHFVGNGTDLPVVHPDYEKRRLHVGDGFGQFAHGAAPLARLYLPTRVPDPDAGVTIEPLPPQNAMVELIRYSFLPREVQRYGLQPARLRHFADLVGLIPVAGLRYPEGLDRLEEVVAALERDLARR